MARPTFTITTPFSSSVHGHNVHAAGTQLSDGERYWIPTPGSKPAVDQRTGQWLKCIIPVDETFYVLPSNIPDRCAYRSGSSRYRHDQASPAPSAGRRHLPVNVLRKNGESCADVLPS